MNNFQQTREVIEYASKKYIKGKTLDLGAGLAKYRDIIKNKATEYITFDIKPGPNIDVVGDILDIPFENESFDTVISTQVIEHVRKPTAVVSEIYRILKPSGICILTAPFLVPYHPDPGDYFRYSKEGLKILFVDKGFEIIEYESYGKFFTVLYEFIRFSYLNPYRKSKRGSWLISRFLMSLAKFLDKFCKSEIIYANVYIIARKNNFRYVNFPTR